MIPIGRSPGVAPIGLRSGILLMMLVVDGFVTAVLEVLYLPSYLGSVPFPASIVVAMVANVVFVIAAMTLTTRTGLVAGPLIGWLLGMMLCMRGTGGGSILLTQHENTRVLLLFVLGLTPALAVLAFQRARVLSRR